MDLYSWSALPIHSMEIHLFISKHNDFSHIYPMRIVIVSVTTWNTTSSWMIPCTGVGLIIFSSDASPMTSLNMCWMIATLEHVAVIYLGWLQPRKSFALAISRLLSLKTVIRLFRNFHHVNIFIPKSAHILLRYTPSLPLAHFPSGGSTLYIISLPQQGGMVTSS